MLVRPRNLADRMSGTQQPETFRLPIDAARLRAREILDQLPQTGYMAVVENWRQLPDGRIEFTKRHLPTADWPLSKRKGATPLTSPISGREPACRGDSMANISEFSIVACERKPGRWRAAITRKTRAGSVVEADKVRSVVTPDDYASESEAELAAQKLISKL
jgi:hypothetical protein